VAVPALDIEPWLEHPLLVTAAAPANIFFQSRNEVIYSPDGGHTWQALPQPLGNPDSGDTISAISPYIPLSVLLMLNRDLYILDLPDAGKSLPRPVRSVRTPSGIFFLATGHTLSGAFKTYWEAHGGLPQFGLPRTEPFRELNPSDGKIYTVQYFERNRFEYHPEYQGSPYEVLLGLLGVQVTVDRRARGHGAFNHFADMHYPGGRYFPETGHNLRSSFLQYWQEHGGLALYGYPISEEYEEVNPDDGRTYIVQYFERNRFEWHPEFRGTPHEVLLGLLGNTLLQQKGWQ
jgi:hypothetical protein